MDHMRILSFIMSVIALILSVFALCGNARAEVGVPEPFSFLNDFTGTIPAQTMGALEIRNRAIEIQKNEETRTTVMTLIIPSTKGEPISDYAQRVAEAWHHGSTSEERGVLLVIATSDKSWAIKTSREVSGTFTDYNAKKLLNQMGAYLKKNKGDFAGAVILFYTEVPQYLKAPPKEVPVTPTANVQSAEDEGFPGWAWALLCVLFVGGDSIAIYLWLAKKDEAERKQRKAQALDALRQARKARDIGQERRKAVHSSWSAPAPVQTESRPKVQRIPTPPPVVDNGEADRERERKRQEALLAERNRQRREQEQREREAQRRREREAEEARQRRMRDADRDSSVSDFATSVLAGALAGAITSSRSEPEPERESRSTYSAPEPEPDRGGSSESYDGGGASSTFD